MKMRPYRLAARTSPSHGGNRGSIPLRATVEQKISRFILGIFCFMALGGSRTGKGSGKHLFARLDLERLTVREGDCYTV